MVDGAARGNPGDAGCGAAIYDDRGTVVKKLSRYLGRTTNNVAEYAGLLMGLESKEHRRAKRFTAYGAAVEWRVPGQG
jgi:ribonuclease HI